MSFPRSARFVAVLVGAAGLLAAALLVPTSSAEAGGVPNIDSTTYSGYVASRDATKSKFRTIMSTTIPKTYCYGDTAAPDTTAALWTGLDGAASWGPRTDSLLQAGVMLNCERGRVVDNFFVTDLDGDHKEFLGQPQVSSPSNAITSIRNPLPIPAGPGDRIIISICATHYTTASFPVEDTGACIEDTGKSTSYAIWLASYHLGRWYNYARTIQYHGPAAYKEAAPPATKAECIMERPTFNSKIMQLPLTPYDPTTVDCAAITDVPVTGSTLVDFAKPQAGYRDTRVTLRGYRTGQVNTSVSDPVTGGDNASGTRFTFTFHPAI